MNNPLEEINRQCRGTLVENLGIEFTAIGKDWLEARMPVDARTLRPGNLLHGGAIMALVETVGSGLSFVLAPAGEYDVFGIEINGNHVHQARGRFVTGRAEFAHRGRRTQVVAVRVTDEDGALVSICRVTNMLLPKEERSH
jgi:uncharacterized protein (TIGR00369 family)